MVLPTFTLIGTLVDVSDRPMPGIEVVATTRPSSQYAFDGDNKVVIRSTKVVTDKDGHFVMSLVTKPNLHYKIFPQRSNAFDAITFAAPAEATTLYLSDLVPDVPSPIPATDASQLQSQIALKADPSRSGARPVGQGEQTFNPMDYGAVGNGTANDTAAVQAAINAATAAGGGDIIAPRGYKFKITDGVVSTAPYVNLISRGGWFVGGSIKVGNPAATTNGQRDFRGTKIDIRYDGLGVDKGLILHNARGLDITGVFKNATKLIAMTKTDGATDFHSLGMNNIHNSHFDLCDYGIYADTDAWDVLSDTQIIDNIFNYANVASIWLYSTTAGQTGGTDGLYLSGNVFFSINYAHVADSGAAQFARKENNVKLGKTNWTRIADNNFFEAGLSALYMENAQNFTIVGNTFAWPGERLQADAIEMVGGSPSGIIEGNAFENWTRAAIGLYNFTNWNEVEVGFNSYKWNAAMSSWTGGTVLSSSNCYRVFASNTGGTGRPIIRGFHVSGLYDSILGSNRLSARDPKSTTGGVGGALLRGAVVTAPNTSVFTVSDIASSTTQWGGIVVIWCIHGTTSAQATYVLALSSEGTVTVIAALGATAGALATDPSFTWSLSGTALRASPVGAASGSWNMHVTSLGSLALR